MKNRYVLAFLSVLVPATSAFATTPTATDLLDPFVDGVFTNAPVAITGVTLLLIAIWIVKKAIRWMRSA